MKLYCTAGRGTELFVKEELMKMYEEKLEQVTVSDGKVYFTIQQTEELTCLLSLKTVERLFVEVLHVETESQDKRSLLTLLHTQLANKLLWEECVATLSCVHTGSDKCTWGTRQAIITNKNKSTKCYKSHCNRKDSEKVKEDSKDESSNIDDKTIAGDRLQSSPCEHSVTQVRKRKDNSVSCDADRAGSVKKPRLSDCRGHVTSFRVSCKFTGSVRHKLNNQRTSKQMGVLISKLMGWKIDLRHPQIEICIHMNDQVLAVGIPVLSEPLSRRSYIQHCGLRSTVAFIMAQLLDIQPGETILDPMCGKATILMEAAQICKDAVYLGVDKDDDQLVKAAENITFDHQSIGLSQGDTRNLLLRDNSIDKIVTDAPFGQSHTTDSNIYVFYLDMLLELARVLKPCATIVLLTSAEMKTFIVACLTKQDTDDNTNQSSKTHDVTSPQPCDLLNETNGNCSEDVNQTNMSKSVMISKSQTDSQVSVKENSEGKKNTDQNITIEIVGSNTTLSEFNTKEVKLRVLLVFVESYYVKLGETDGYICVLHKTS